jgi:hypothetical protein
MGTGQGQPTIFLSDPSGLLSELYGDMGSSEGYERSAE